MECIISIIVPAYQVEKCLDRCVESILNQTYKHLEVILVDDGSTDKTASICDSWAEKDQRVKVIHKVNEGPSVARNAALEIARGDYIYFVDSDDYIDPNLCENVLNVMLKESADIVVFNGMRVNEHGQEIFITDDIVPGAMDQETALAELMGERLSHFLWNKMYKREVFQGVRFPSGRIWEDMSTTYRLFLNAKKIYCCEEVYYYYVQNSSSIISNINAKALKDIFLARSESYQELKDKYPRLEKIMFPGLALSAIRLYDRSLWEKTDKDVLKQAKLFLSQNKRAVLSCCPSTKYRMYYYMPGLYQIGRLAIHFAGIVLRMAKLDRGKVRCETRNGLRWV